ncbi:pyrogenic exotoxin B [Bacteroides heparinolyticus]|uniref:Pyrogenic exotoxin B n=1 Tax=Prevotella heparinolytica TaxID=28113 RepID=A0A449I0I7_9BACE|nr:C10 family peptidase [Bacteroides heparinolyticus]VFB12980.1 pyrogenic exotoxin B [Bacteroides heparinolyticus]
MKGRSFFLLFLLLACSCSNNEGWEWGRETPVVDTGSRNRSLEEALSIARDAIAVFAGNKTRSVEREIDLANIEYVIAAPVTRGAGRGRVDTLLYVVNYAGGKGFAVVSGNKDTEGLLAVTEKGTYRAEQDMQEENGGFSMFMELAKNYVASKKPSLRSGDDRLQLMEMKREIDTTDVFRIDPKVVVQWGQQGYEGDYAPNGVAGCANTAMGQMMSYFEHPASINLTYADAGMPVQVLDWQAIKQHRINHFYQDCSASTEAHQAIGRLLRQLGELNQSYYEENGGTNTSALNVRNTFQSMGYSVSALTGYTNGNFSSDLSNDRLVYMRGSCDYQIGGNVGHAWVVDGCYEYKVHYTEWVRPIGGSVWELIWESDTEHEYMHINWGFDGQCNGFFSAGVFNTDQAYQYDNTSFWFTNNEGLNFQYRLFCMMVSR